MLKKAVQQGRSE